MYSFMEGARLRCSVALPRFVTKPTVVEDNGEKVTLKAGQEIICNLVSPLVSFFLSLSWHSDTNRWHEI